MSTKYLENLRKLKKTHQAKGTLNPKDGFSLNVPLRDYMRSGLGGVADYFIEAPDLPTIIDAAKKADAQSVPYTIIGGGTNVLCSDIGFPGLIIHNQVRGILPLDSSHVLVYSGTKNFELLNKLVTMGLSGIEFLSTIPGTVGGAVYCDAKSDKESIYDTLVESTWLIKDSGELTTRVLTSQQTRLLAGKDFLEAVPTNRPILLTLKLHLRKALPEEIVARMAQYRKAKQYDYALVASLKGKDDNRIAGYFYNQAIAPELVKDRDMAKYFKGPIRLDKNNPNILHIDKTIVSTEDILVFMEELRTDINKTTGDSLKYGINLLGYYPDE